MSLVSARENRVILVLVESGVFFLIICGTTIQLGIEPCSQKCSYRKCFFMVMNIRLCLKDDVQMWSLAIKMYFCKLLRLLMLLAVADTLHLLFSLSSFSLPTLVPAFYTRAYQYTLPYTLPLAQVHPAIHPSTGTATPCHWFESVW